MYSGNDFYLKSVLVYLIVKAEQFGGGCVVKLLHLYN